jgi:hypothetical protein
VSITSNGTEDTIQNGSRDTSSDLEEKLDNRQVSSLIRAVANVPCSRKSKETSQGASNQVRKHAGLEILGIHRREGGSYILRSSGWLHLPALSLLSAQKIETDSLDMSDLRPVDNVFGEPWEVRAIFHRNSPSRVNKVHRRIPNAQTNADESQVTWQRMRTARKRVSKVHGKSG